MRVTVIVLFLLFTFIDSTVAIKQKTIISKADSLHFAINSGINYAWYRYRLKEYSFNNVEYTIGLSYKRDLLNKVSFNVSLQGGVKAKNIYDNRFDTYSYNTNDNLGSTGIFVIEIDNIDRVLATNHYFIEFPFLCEYKLSSNISLGLGYSYRYYLPNNDNLKKDFLVRSFDNGIVMGVNLIVLKRVVLNINTTIGITKLNSKYYLISSNDGSMDNYKSGLNSRIIQFKIGYKLF